MTQSTRATMMEPALEDLLVHVDGSKFTLVALTSRRARQVNAYFNQLSDGLGAIVPPQVSSVARKPLSIALEEVAAGKIVPVYPDPEAEAAAAAEKEAAASAAAADAFAAALGSESTPDVDA